MMTVFVGDILNATAAPVVAYAGSTRTLQWLRNGSAIPSATATAYRVTDAEIANAISVLQLETNFMGSASATSAPTATVQAWSPSTLFALSEPGVWFDPSDLSTLYQDAAGKTPVTAPEQPVGLVLDKSQGLVLGPELVTNGDFSNGTTGWSAGNSATIAATSGVAQVTQTSSNLADIRQTLTTVAGRTYRVSCEIASQNGASIVAVAQDTSTFAVIQQSAAVTSASLTTVSFVFTANAATTRIAVRFNASGASGNTFTTDNISVRELPGFHATQSTAANCPTYGVVPSRGRVNLFEQTEDFAAFPWAATIVGTSTRTNASSVYTFGLGLITATSANGGIRQSRSGLISGQPYTLSFYLESATPTVSIVFENGTAAFGNQHSVNITPSTGAFSLVTGFTSTTSVPFGNGRIYTMVTANAGGNLIANIEWRIATSGGSILLGRPQFELGSTATPYQRVASQFDVTDPAGFPSYPLHYLFFGGDLDPRWLQTATITPNADKVQVFAGVRKLSDAARGTVVELSNTVNDGTFRVEAPHFNGSTSFQFSSRGTAGGAGTIESGAQAAPVTRVLTGLGDISGDLATLRVNGTQVAQSTADQGTGNYLAYPLFIGRRGGASLAFNGQLYGLIVRFGANLSTSVINRAEYFVSQKTGVTL